VAQTLFGTAYFGTSYFAITPNTFTYVGSGGATSGGAATTSVLHIKAYTGAGGGTAGGAASTNKTKAFTASGGATPGGAATTSEVQIKRPASTDSAGNWTAVPSGTISSVTSDQSDSTYANLAPAGQPSTFVVTLSTLYQPVPGNGTLVIRSKVA
jgi:hypothetical protein